MGMMFIKTNSEEVFMNKKTQFGIAAMICGFGIIAYFSFYNYGLRIKNDNINMESDVYEKNPILIEESTVYAGLNKEPLIKDSTSLTIEIYNKSTDEITTREQNFTPEFFGMNREQYLDSLKENQVLLSFDSTNVTVREYEEYAYFLKLNDNKVSVYSEDGETFYFNSVINTNNLNGEELDRLSKGIYLRDVDELYSFLEGHTS